MDINNIKDRNELVNYFVELGFKKGAEVGVEQPQAPEEYEQRDHAGDVGES